jgi:hypothetical protein
VKHTVNVTRSMKLDYCKAENYESPGGGQILAELIQA